MKFTISTNIRDKLMMSLISVVLVTGISSSIVGLWIIKSNVVGQAYDNVQSYLTTAEYIYNHRIHIINLFMDHLASLPYLKTAIVTRDRQLLVTKLREMMQSLNIDVLNITDPDGKVLVRAGNPGVTGDIITGDPYIEYVKKTGKPCWGSDIMPKKHLDLERQGLAAQACIGIVPAKLVQKEFRHYVDDGLVIKAAAPVFKNGKLVGIIYGARLLNRNYEFVDRIKNLVFKDEKINGFDLGSATIFLGDVRISTNVKRKGGGRAIGTRISNEVFQQVHDRGKLWLDKAFVVDKWYISAYSPIRDIRNNVIGVLYVGLLEEKFDKVKRETTFFFLLIIIFSTLIAIFITSYLIHHIINPVKTLVEASNEIARGNYTISIPVESRDELGYLCNTFNLMVAAIVERDNKLKEQTQKQIAQSEKLASLGRLASGIAHEINNPLTGVLTYSSVLLEDLRDTEYREDLDVIVGETLRCRKIVQEILDFARETRLEKARVNLNRVIHDALSILEKNFNFQNIKIVRKFRDTIPEVWCDVNLFKSVINNLALNAADAMPDGGTLEIATDYNEAEDSVVLTFADTGSGISEEDLDKIFDPFFTTKETGKGTGLGLAVSYGIVQRHKGIIDVKSSPGQGTTFTIMLPVAVIDA